tara:strand:+ start:821 stop:1027 length:207 start_codon:yes stop_codon:yes gene_type:complete
MLQPNQIKRLILQTQLQLDSLKEHNLLNVDPDMVSYRKGLIHAWNLVLKMDPATINNLPINKEKTDDT